MAIQDFDHRFEPFGNEADYRLYYNSKPHAKALIAINEGIAAGEGFVAVTGEAGSGKTTLLSFVLSRLEPGRYVAARLDARECENLPVLRLIARGFGMTATEADEAALERKLRKFLSDSRRRGRRGLLLVDEAQDLPPAAFEALLNLSRPHDDEGQVLQTVLFGQASLRDLLYGHDLSRYRLNVVASHHLQALDLEETRRLIDHRLRQAGSSGDKVFAEDSVEMIHLQTGGIPGRVVDLCRDLMERAAAMGLGRVDGSVIQHLSLKRKRDWVRDEGRDEEAQARSGVVATLHLSEPAPPEADEPGGPEDALPSFLANGRAEDGDHAGGISRLPVIPLSVALTIGLSALVVFAWQGQKGLPPDRGITVALSEAEPALAPEAEAVSSPEAESAATPEAEAAREVPQPTGTPSAAPKEQAALQRASESRSLPQDAAGFVVPPPPPALDEAPATTDATPTGTGQSLVEPDIDDAVVRAPAPVVEETRSRGSAPVIKEEPDERARPGAVEKAEESAAAADPRVPPAPDPDDAGALAGIPAASGDAPATGGESASPGPIDLTAWKTSGQATAPAATAGEPSTGEISNLGDKTVSQPAAAEPETAIVENARLAAAATEAKAPAEAATAADLSITQLVLARQIEDREPLGLGEAFAMTDKQVYAFARVRNTGPRTEVSFRWYLNDAFVGAVPMKVGTSPGWRTWSVVPLDPGAWRVEVAGPNGEVLAQRAFLVK